MNLVKSSIAYYRLCGAFFLALLVTVGLLSLMQQLVGDTVEANAQTQSVALRDILLPKRERQTQYDEVKPEKPITTPQPLIAKSPVVVDLPKINVDAVTLESLPIEPELAVDAIGGFVADGEYLPIYRARPNYPSNALRRGVEGFVIIEFTVTADGTVENLSVVESNPKGWFEKAALKAAKKFKYKPRMIDGQAIAVSGVRTKITFKLE